MLKVKDGTVIEGSFNDEEFIPIVVNSEFSTLLVQIDLENFEPKCVEITTLLAGEGKQYGTDYVIVRRAVSES